MTPRRWEECLHQQCTKIKADKASIPIIKAKLQCHVCGFHSGEKDAELMRALVAAYGGKEEASSRHGNSRNSQQTADEYFAFYKEKGYDIAGSALALPVMLPVLSALRLDPEKDVFMDLGSGAGRLTNAVALMTGCHSIGVELSPSRHDEALAAKAQLCKSQCGTLDSLIEKVTFLQGDLLETDMKGATVVWCAVRPSAGKRIASDLIRLIRRNSSAVVRLFLIGYCLTEQEELHAAHIFVDSMESRAIQQLYGGNLGVTL